MSDAPVLIVGAGLAGLSCARYLAEAGVPLRIFEQADAVGGRVRTDEINGFRLDRGFQVLLDAYPEAVRQLDYDALKLQRFHAGALIRSQGKFRRLADPLRQPRHALQTAFSPLATLKDKLAVFRLKQRLARSSWDQLLLEDDSASTRVYLSSFGFTDRFIERFFRPFFGGVFLDRELETSAKLFRFLFQMFDRGSAVLPEGGMQAIPDQLASRLPAGTLQLEAKVDSVASDHIMVQGERIAARRVVLATDGDASRHLVPSLSASLPLGFRGTTCFYYAADSPPVAEPILILDGDGEGPVNHLCCPSQVASTYAPAGRTLISASVVSDGQSGGDDPSEAAVRSQMTDWFGHEARSWTHLRTYRIPQALPAQDGASLRELAFNANRVDGMFVCGDHVQTASIQGAMQSGRLAAEAILAESDV